ncbi:CGNR zinc finger domain-containing protein [Paenibacillus nasutitermitis]|uniref:CGNR zinc finger domain-containing protein n=1 Tax=Paenibacillus nasutitermitis TaxID=1652958 RepID=UPI00166A3838|nr:CGNR zinc finger domain-containing protein [Paenibacillus nasutitermitis]
MKTSNFIFIGNHFVTDFVNTRKNVKGARTELLHDYGDLMDWLEQSGKSKFVSGNPDSLPSSRRGELFQNIMSFRDDLEQAFVDMIREKSVPTFITELINKSLKSNGGYLQIEQSEASVALARYYTTSQLFVLFLEEAALFFASIKPDNLKKCENEACILYFYDTSRNQQRRWCSMEKCGNRVKVNQHYHRKKNRIQ